MYPLYARSHAGQHFGSDRDLLGDYEFNPFVDEELDYDEDMEDPDSAAGQPPEPKADSGEDSKEEEEEEGLCTYYSLY